MKTSIFLPLALEYDPEERESLQKSFGVTENELLRFMRTIGTEVKLSGEDGAFAQDIMMRMIKDGELSHNMILYLASFGSNKLWETFADGIFLVLDAEEESGDKAE